MSTDRNKLIILGFDGASPDLLEKWVSMGHLPTIGKMMEAGAYGPLESVPNMSSPAAWTSFSTGVNPGKHGIFSFTERNFCDYRYTYVNGTNRRALPFWKMLGEGNRVSVINIPMTYPAEEVNGCMIAGLDAPGVDSERLCYPEGLVEELKRQNGGYTIMPDFGGLLRRGAHWGATVDRFLDAMELRAVNAEYIMEKYPADLTVVVHNETDLAHHFFWKFMDTSHPDYRAEEAQRYGDSILRIYQKMDNIVDRVIGRHPDANVIIVSDHGGGMNSRGVELVNDWLESLGLHNKMGLKDGNFLSRGVQSVTRVGFELSTRYLSQSMKHRLARMMPAMREKGEAAVRLQDIDWQRTKAFCDGAQDDIWINMAGRDPQGVVPSTEYDEICNFICRELRDSVDVVTGEKIVDLVYRPRDIFFGDHMETAPDVAIRWKVGGVINGIVSPSSRKNAVKPKQWTWDPASPTGGHSLYGILLGAGPDISVGSKLTGARLMDMTPNILYLLDRQIPGDLDGKVLEQLFEAERFRSKPPRYSSASAGKQKREESYSADDSAVIEQRLRDLGYI